MKKEQKLNKKNLLNTFIKEELGVYTIMMSGLSFILLALMAVGFESSSLLLDKARLSDTLEQASLALTAENNEKRTDAYKLADGKKIEERNIEIVMEYLEAYMPKANRNKAQEEKGITAKDKSKDYVIDIASYKIKQEIGYELSVGLPRSTIFPMKFGKLELVPDEVRMGLESKAVKFKESTIPIDLMIVADFSTSMLSAIPGEKKTKIQTLKDVVNTLAKENLFKKEEEDGIKNENRIAITTFSFGGQQFGDSSNQCVIPFKFKDYDKDSFEDLRSEYKKLDGKKNRFDWSNYYNYLALLKNNAYDLEDAIEQYGKDSKKAWTDYLNILYRMPSDHYGLKIEDTVSQIKDFDGKAKGYEAKFNKNVLCMRYNTNSNSISTLDKNGKKTPWFSYEDYKNGDFTKFFGTDQKSGIQPGGSTLVSAGLLIGANAILNDPNKKAQRVLLVLSDGDDAISHHNRPEEQAYGEMTDDLIYGKKDDGYASRYNKDYAMCDRIRERMDSIVTYEKDDPRIPSKIAFVGFGTGSRKEAVWRYCVGNNYFKADNEVELLNAFKQAIGLPEEVGFSKY